MGGPRTALVLSLAAGALLAPAASASAGGAPAGAAESGGVEYGVPVSKGRPVATAFSLSPRRVVAGTAPKVTVRIDQPGVRTIAARVVLLPLRGQGAVVRADLGRVPTGRFVKVAWPARVAAPPAGTYRAQLHAKDPYGATLRRSGRASGRASLVVVAPAPKPKPKPAAPVVPPTPAPAAPTAPVVRNGGVFPVGGPHGYGDGIGVGREGHTHQGVDVTAAEGTPMLSPTAGTVRYVDYQAGGAGHYVVVDAADGRSFFFAHIKAGTITVAPGAALTPGQQFAQVGSTGDSSGPHLHFEIWEGGWRVDKNSHFIDPLPQLKAWDA